MSTINKIKFIIISLLFISQFATSVNIIPQPNFVQQKPGNFDIVKNNNIIYQGNLTGISNLIDNFTIQALNDYKLSLRSNKALKGNIVLKDNKRLTHEAYELIITKKSVEIQASSAAGFFYAFCTINQLLLAAEKDLSLPCMILKDYPRFSHRGFLIDAGRYYLPIEDVKKAIDIASIYKLNRFHWHLTDDQGWRLEIKKYPLLTQKGSIRSNSSLGNWDQYYPRHFDGIEHSGYYTQDEIREIVKYASERQITIIPEIEMPGHSLAALSAYPQFACSFHSELNLMTGAGISEQVYCPKPATIQFIKNILTEVTDIFPSEYIHIGGDETPKSSWKKCEDCQELIKREGLKDEYELHAYFIQQVEKIASDLGRKIIGWDEILEGGLPLNATVMSWRGESGGIKAAKLGNEVIMTPNTYCYLDYYQEDPEYAPLAIGGFVPLEKTYDYEPIPESLTPEEAKLIKGIQGNIWGEYVSTFEKFEYMAYPRLIAIAEVAWTMPENKNRDSFISNLKKEFSFFEKRNINACREYFQPRINGTWNDDKNVFEVNLNTIYPKGVIRYTLDGSEPTAESDIYESPISISKNSTVKSIITNSSNKVLESPSIKNFVISKAIGCNYTVSPEPWSLDWYNIKAGLFTDGILGYLPSNSEWVSLASGVEIIIDLRKEVIVNGVRFGTLIAPINSVLPVKSMKFYTSNDGTEYKLVGESSFTYPLYKGEKDIYRNVVNSDGSKGRYLKVILNGQTELPPYFPYPNGESYIAVDEIEVF